MFNLVYIQINQLQKKQRVLIFYFTKVKNICLSNLKYNFTWNFEIFEKLTI